MESYARTWPYIRFRTFVRQQRSLITSEPAAISHDVVRHCSLVVKDRPGEHKLGRVTLREHR